MSPASLSRKFLLIVAVFGSMIGFAPAAHAQDDSANAALAEQYHLIAQLELDVVPLEDHHLTRAAALLGAAAQLDPMQPRHPRLLAAVHMLRGDREAALTALNNYGKLRPDDEVARIQYVDLVTAGMQNAQNKVAFLQNRIVDNERLSDGLRSHAAVKLHDLHVERGQQAKADAALAKALELNDVNPAARQRSFEKTLRTGDALDRITALCELLRSNVAQPAVMTSLGSELARLNMLEEALDWYERGNELALEMQLRGVPADYVDQGALLLINSQPQEARVIGLTLQQDAENFVVGEQIALLSEKQQEIMAEGVMDQMSARFDQLVTDLAGEAEFDMAGREPTAVVVELFETLLAADPFRADVLIGQIDAVVRGDLLIAEKPTNPDLLAALTELVGEKDPLIVSYAGLQALREGTPDAARVKFDAVKDQHPFAAMGLVLLDAADAPADEIRARASDVLNDRPFGITGAFVFDQLRQFNVRVLPPENLPAIRNALAVFPSQLLDLLDPAEQRNFYDVRMRPLRIAHEYGSPMYVRVTIANTGEYPLTLGPGGVIRSELQFDASVGNQGAIPAVAIGQIGGQVRLDRNEETTRDYRIDLGVLNQALATDPSRPITIFVSAITNPVQLQGERVGPGPGGFRTQMRQPIERGAKALGNAEVQDQLFTQIVRGAGGEKIRAIQTLTRYVQLFELQNQAVAEAGEGPQIEQAEINAIARRIRRARDVEIDPAVRSWAGLAMVQLAAEEERVTLIDAMVSDDDPTVRLGGLMATLSLNKPEQASIAASLTDDPDPEIAAYAAGVLAIPAEETGDEAPAGQ
ncbi:MAG: hypothetical protein AAGD32_02355 [Planctomycetota bacterium]